MPTLHTLHKFFTISNLIEGIDDNNEVLRQIAMFQDDTKYVSPISPMFEFHRHMNHLNPYCKPWILRTYDVFVGWRKCISPHTISPNLDALFLIEPKTWREIKNWHITFEHIHPFWDGNWRVWRYLMLRQLVDNWHTIPQMFLSRKNFEENRRKYYRWF